MVSFRTTVQSGHHIQVVQCSLLPPQAGQGLNVLCLCWTKTTTANVNVGIMLYLVEPMRGTHTRGGQNVSFNKLLNFSFGY